jgi:hypothetical protein
VFGNVRDPTFNTGDVGFVIELLLLLLLLLVTGVAVVSFVNELKD